MLVVYTAAHCIVVGENKIEKIKIRLQDGREFIASHNNSGNFLLAPETEMTEEELETWIRKNNPHDWAIYNIPEQYYNNIPYTFITDKNHSNALHNATVVGYGLLKIMSNNDIDYFKQEYINYLKGRPQNKDHGFVNDNIAINNHVVLNFLYEHQSDISDVIFNDNKKLKQSKCEYGGEFNAENCQVWAGNSGGPVYDNENRIMGIVTLGNFLIGCSFILPASIIYHRKKDKKHALVGMVTGTVFMAVVGCFINAYVLLPAYSVGLSMPLETIIGMGTAINPAITNIMTFVVLAVAPFNLLKGVVVSILTFLLYKRISGLIKAHH
jgi:hypothetical protein